MIYNVEKRMKEKPVVAWEVSIDDVCSIVFATTAPKARWICVRSYWDAGYGTQGGWPRATARRAPRHDDSVLKDRSEQKAWIPEYVETKGGKT